MKPLKLIVAGVVVAAGALAAPTVLNANLVPMSNVSSLAGSSLSAATATTFKNCTALNKKYPHGIGKPGARDKVRGSTKPVTNFYVNASLYKANKKSDRDGDGVACEKR